MCKLVYLVAQAVYILFTCCNSADTGTSQRYRLVPSVLYCPVYDESGSTFRHPVGRPPVNEEIAPGEDIVDMEFLEGNVAENYSKLKRRLDSNLVKLRSRLSESREACITGKEISDSIGCLVTQFNTNVPVTLSLWDEMLSDPRLTLTEKLKILHQKLLGVVSLGPISDGLTIAHTAYDYIREDEDAWDINDETVNFWKFKTALDLGSAYRMLGKLPDASRYIEEAQALSGNTGDPSHQALARIHYGIWLLAKGELQVAIDEAFTPLLNNPAIEMDDTTFGLLKQHLGNAYRSAALWGPAKDNLKESIKIAERIGDEIAASDRRGDLGNVFRSEGRIKDAIEHQRMQFDFAMKRGDLGGICVSCFNIGFAYYTLKPQPAYDDALLYLTMQYELGKRIGDYGMEAKALNCLGKVYTALSKPRTAIDMFNKCVELHIQTGNVAGEGMAYGNLGTVYREIGEYAKAVEFHEKYRVNAQKRLDTGGVAIMQRETALDYYYKQDYQMAEKHIKDSIITAEEIRTQLGGEDKSRIANFEKNQAEAFHLLQIVLVQQLKYTEALALAEYGRARSLRDIAEKKLNVNQDEPTSSMLEEKSIDTFMNGVYDTADTMNTTIVFYSLVTETRPGIYGQKWIYTWVVKPARARVERETCFAKVLLAGETAARETKQLDEGYYNTLLRSMADFSHRDAEIVNTLYADEDEDGDWEDDDTSRDGETAEPTRQRTTIKIRRMTEEKQLKKQQREELEKKWRAELSLNYEVLMSHIDAMLPKSSPTHIPHLTFVPQDFLFSIPFAAFICPDGKYLIEKYTVSVVPSINMLQLTHQRLHHLRSKSSSVEIKVLSVGNPSFHDKLKLSSLEAAEEEAHLVKRTFSNGNSETLIGSEATKVSVVEKMKHFDIVHLATHASHQNPPAHKSMKSVAHADFGMQGFVVLSPSDDETCYGLLSADEILETEVNAQMVVLSCCNTGLGQVTGDGVLGIYRSFLASGVPNVIATLWRIPDKATHNLMSHFYTHYKVQHNAAVSMRLAMLEMIKSKLHSKPPQWAAFTVIGATADW